MAYLANTCLHCERSKQRFSHVTIAFISRLRIQLKQQIIQINICQSWHDSFVSMTEKSQMKKLDNFVFHCQCVLNEFTSKCFDEEFLNEFTSKCFDCVQKKHQKKAKKFWRIAAIQSGHSCQRLSSLLDSSAFFGMHIGVQITRNTSVCMPDMSVSLSAAFGQEGTSKKAADKYTKGLSKVAKSSLRVRRERSDLQKQQAARKGG